MNHLTDAQFETIVQDAEAIGYLIVKSGGMATKSRVEDALMAMYDFDRSDAHSITNHVEGRKLAYRIGGGVHWVADRPEPRIEHYPEIMQPVDSTQAALFTDPALCRADVEAGETGEETR